jgi:ribosomal protein L11 methyltransferase
MLALFPEGFEERQHENGLELAAYGGAEAEERLAAALGGVEVTEVETGWEERWKDFHRPVRIGPLWVGPPWEEPEAGAVAVVIDPGRAFGTGSHPTTRLCLELLLGLEPTSLLDLGCGSGVLAVAAAKIGFSPVAAVDSDEAAVAAARRNAEENGVLLEVRRAEILRDPLPEAAVVVANIALPIVEEAARRIEATFLVASGYLAAERPDIPDWRALERRESGGWAADLLERFYH